MKPLAWLWVVGLVGCTQLAGLGDYTFDLDAQTGGSAGATGGSSGGTGGSTGGTGAMGGTAGSSGGTGGSTGGTGAMGGTAGSTGGEGGIGGMAGSTGGEGGTGGCSTTCGALEELSSLGFCVAKSVQMPGYAIDATEVTRCQYYAWLSTNPSTAGQPNYCAWNTSFTPKDKWPPGSEGDHPVVHVDWCDAYAYCKAVGKRLCGKIGGGYNVPKDYDNASSSQWYAACSSGGDNNYPYGNSYMGNTCNGSNYGAGTTLSVASLPGCQSTSSSYAGVYDMSGNVREWEDSCSSYDDNGLSGNCRYRGGSFLSGESALRCDNNEGNNRNSYADYIGFRCCSDP